MIITTSWLAESYNKFNKLYFKGDLPCIEFKVNHSRNTWGFASYRYDWDNDTIHPLGITLSNYYDSPEDVKIQTLLHEMIHIADYFFHPEHYIKNGRKVSKRTYNPHGQWFMNEAQRITKESGYKITNHVTKEEIGKSCLSVRTQRIINNKIKIARFIVASDGNSCWLFKTDVYKIENVKRLIKRQMPKFNKIVEYTFTNERLLTYRSCNTVLSGWHYSKQKMMELAQKHNFTMIRSYHI